MMLCQYNYNILPLWPQYHAPFPTPIIEMTSSKCMLSTEVNSCLYILTLSNKAYIYIYWYLSASIGFDNTCSPLQSTIVVDNIRNKDKFFEADKYVNADEAYKKIKFVHEKTQTKQKKAVCH